MGSSRRKYTAEYRRHAVELVRESGKPIAEVARDLGVNEGTLANWVNRSRQSESRDEQPNPAPNRGVS